MSNSQTRNGGGDLVLDHLHLDPRADDLLPLLHRPDPPHVDPARAVELQGPAARGGLGAAEHHADLLADLVDEDQDGLRRRDRLRQLPQGLAHQARLDAHRAVADVPFQLRPRHHRGHRVDDHDVHRGRLHQHLGDLQRLLGAARLAHQQRLDVHPQPLAPGGVERVLHVDERGDAPDPLGVGDRVQRDRRLAAGLRPEQLDDPPARQALAAQGQVERQRPGGDALHLHVAAFPHLHDRAGAERLLDLAQRVVQRLLLGRRPRLRLRLLPGHGRPSPRGEIDTERNSTTIPRRFAPSQVTARRFSRPASPG